MEEQNKDLQDYLITLRKRKTGVLVIAITILVISTAVAFLLPPTYKSSATILIEQQEIPSELVQSTVTSYAAERIQVIQARVMSRTNLLEIVEKFDLYPERRKRATSEEIVARMREDVGLDVISAQVVDPRTGRPSAATIAFSLSYQGETPSTIQRVVNELTSLYLNENLKSRTQKAEETSLFFEEETRRLGNQIGDLEQKLAVFKQQNADMLPELQQLNLQLLQRLESEITGAEAQIRSLEEKKFYLSGQLAFIDPADTENMGPASRLKLLETQYASIKSRYSEDHPDVQNLKREIELLRMEVGTTGNKDYIADQLSEQRADLARARERYTADHPDVVKLQESIAVLEQDLKSIQDTPEDKYFQSRPDNPLYVNTQTQLATIDIEIRALLNQKQQLIEKLAKLEERLLKAPQVEQEYLTLQRDYENAVAQYRETKAKQMKADVAKQLESERKGERFTLIDPAALPEKPISPNRPVILLLGVVLSLGGGVGFAFVADIISGAVRGAKSIENMLGLAPLAVIPYQVSMSEVEKRSTIKKRTIILAILTVIAAVLVIHFLVSPLDVLWFRILRKLDILMS